jgi:imidazolonepropionase-like amidohydrolase/Tol biopolymer transport system component
MIVRIAALLLLTLVEESSWDVSKPFGPTTTLGFETTEGTWMNVDLSPDGKTLVFDLLGDLYLMPVEGGTARRLTSGAAFDMQPRFSPDGRHIAFSSDRDGLWNLWTVEASGENPRQVSREKKWFVNSPAWSADGDYLFARHHFVKERSLGAGEIWMYHVDGSDGLQVTEKTNWQKDAGEPSLSPDGRYLYYSKDVAPGENFEYNKDPNAAIYAVVRRDLRTGEERREVEIQGGAVTPLASPDGKRLAFIRRVRLESILYLRDLATGEQWPIFDGLDKDLQEAWAMHGLYPQYAFSPDGRNIFIWGGGRIWRVDVEARRGTEVPFSARIEQETHDALRFRQQVYSDEFPVRMLRHVVVSPDGSEVLYSALGRLYRKTLPDGDPARFSRDERIELAPSYSRDGQWVVYATWSDGDKGRIRIAGRDGSSARDLVSVRGHYTEPSFSPDGRKVVYRRVEGDDVRGEENSTDPGIYLVDSAGSEPRLIRTSGSEPRFDSSGERIYFRERRGEKVVLASVDLDGAKERIHFESENATSIVPSPDDGFVAFAERFKIFVAPFPKTGRPVTLGPGVKAFPVVEVSKEAGLYLHWSGDGRKLHWSLGPELFTVSRDAAFGAEFETERIPIGFRIASDLPTGTIALVGARVLTMAGSEQDSVLENATIVIEKNRIAAVGPSGSTKVPPGATRVDVSGRTIVPGLIDVHAHLGSESAGVLSEQSWPLVANLAYGVTTSHDPSNNTEMVFTNSEMIRAGAKLGPRLYSTGMILYGAETPFKADIQTYEDALSHLRRMKAVGAFTVKSYNQQRRDVRQMIVKAARELEMMVVPEGGSLLYMDETFVYDGHTGLEHSLPVPALYQDVATLFGKSATGYTPTLIVGFGGLSGEYYWYQHDEVWQNERLLDFVPREVVDARARRRTMAPEDDFHHVQIAEGAKKILDAGGKVQLGAHGQLQGLGVHWELWMLAQGGMTPFQALRAATLSGAEYIGLDAELGSIQVGKLADLVVLAGNPLENIRSSESVLQVMVNGRLYDAATMNEVGNHPRVRPPFYWQVPD